MSTSPAACWEPHGYPLLGVFPAAAACRFRLCHVRADGLAVLTLGDYRERGRSEPLPIAPPFHFASWVVRLDDDEAASAPMDRAACQDWRTATAQHLALLDAWATRETEP